MSEDISPLRITGYGESCGRDDIWRPYGLGPYGATKIEISTHFSNLWASEAWFGVIYDLAVFPTFLVEPLGWP